MERNQKLVSACLIVKNESDNLKKTLPALVRLADEIIVVDTGSSDNTVEIARQYGARIEHFTWIDDYAAARNYSIQFATGDWIFFPDADELVDETAISTLREYLAQTPSDAVQLKMFQCPMGMLEKKAFSERVKIFRNHCGFRFIRPINERVVDAQGSYVTGSTFECGGLFHWGTYLPEERMEEKRARYIRLYGKFLESHPQDADVHYLLAVHQSGSNQPEESIHHYLEAAKYAGHIGLRQIAQSRAAWLLFELRRIPEAVQIIREIREEGATPVSIQNLMACISLAGNKPEIALQLLRDITHMTIPNRAAGTFVDADQYRAFPYFLLGNAYKMLGDVTAARQAYQTSLTFRESEPARKAIEELDEVCHVH